MRTPFFFRTSSKRPWRLTAIALAAAGLVGCKYETSASLSQPALAASSDTPSTSTVHLRAAGQLGPGRGTLLVDLKAPEGGKLTEGGPLVVRATGEDLSFPERLRTRLKAADLPLRLPVDVADGAQGTAEVELHYYWCRSGASASCQPERAKLYVELDLSGSHPGGEAHLTHRPRAL